MEIIARRTAEPVRSYTRSTLASPASSGSATVLNLPLTMQKDQHHASFIKNKKIGRICNLPDNDPKIANVNHSILNIVIKEKQRKLYSCLLKCNAKELACKRLLPSHLWRRIEGGSRLICDSVRSKVKSSLSAKYDRLSGTVCENNLDRGKDLPNIHRSHDAPSENDIEKARVTVIGDIYLSTHALAFLSLGPSFSPSQSINALTCRRIVGGLQKLRDMLRNKARREAAPQSSAPEYRRLLPTAPFPRSFYKEAQPFPAADIEFRVLSSGILEVLNKFKRVHQSNLSREHWQGLKEVRSLIAGNSIRLSVSDKGGEFVVLPTTLDRDITELHLSDTTIYQRATEKEFLTQCKRLNDAWISVGKSAGLDERFISRLKLDKPICPVFYSLVKTHKISPEEMHSMSAKVYKIRPIISCVGGPTDRISWFLNKIVSQLLSKVPSHLSNTEHFLQRLHNARFDQGCVVESFDVTSLYTNVQNDEALQALSELLDKHAQNINTFGLNKARILTLIRECLNCNIFKWSGKYFSQTPGLVMGQRLAPVLAICFMSRIEEPVLARLPVMYCRYIDDCYVVTSTQSEMDECFKIPNEQSQYIRHRKGTSKNILIHAKYAHPAAVKRAVLRNMFKTAANLCTGEDERCESKRTALKIANSNGYSKPQYQRRPSRAAIQSRTPRNSKLPLCLPFFSDRVSAAFQQCIIRAHLQDDAFLVNIPNDSIKKQLVRNRLYDKYCTTEQCVVCPHGNIGDCSKVGVVYQLECLTCHDLYIGETGRTLSVRVREHMATKRRGNLTSPLGRHKIEAHGGNDFDIKCKILAYEEDISARKALEAAWIFTRSPGMNSKNECLSLTSDLLPFLSLCGLSVDHIRSGRAVPSRRPLQRSRAGADNSAKGGTPGGSEPRP